MIQIEIGHVHGKLYNILVKMKAVRALMFKKVDKQVFRVKYTRLEVEYGCYFIFKDKKDNT
eukprot:snap_masked-scaffold_6-processed-gene-6.38-mRNA-1 protein AED:1.00 eAED:1.00 QI:0/0/0/0/1/1/2/0/60